MSIRPSVEIWMHHLSNNWENLHNGPHGSLLLSLSGASYLLLCDVRQLGEVGLEAIECLGVLEIGGGMVESGRATAEMDLRKSWCTADDHCSHLEVNTAKAENIGPFVPHRLVHSFRIGVLHRLCSWAVRMMAGLKMLR